MDNISMPASFLDGDAAFNTYFWAFQILEHLKSDYSEQD